MVDPLILPVSVSALCPLPVPSYTRTYLHTLASLPSKPLGLLLCPAGCEEGGVSAAGKAFLTTAAGKA